MIIGEDIRDKVSFLLEEASHKIILPFYQNLTSDQIEIKSSLDDFVTIADKRVEFFLTNALIKLIENSKVVGEEASWEDNNYWSMLTERFVWTVDPIDGTKNFIKGNSQFCSMVALLHYGKPVASWIYIPKSSICYFADEHGVQVKYSDSQYKPTKISRFNTPELCIGDLRFTASLRYLSCRLKKKVKKGLGFFKKRVYTGSVGIEATLIANAEIDFIFYSAASPWDHAPVDMFNRASGGKTGQINLIDKTFYEMKISNTSPILFVRSKELWEDVTQLILKYA